MWIVTGLLLNFLLLNTMKHSPPTFSRKIGFLVEEARKDGSALVKWKVIHTRKGVIVHPMSSRNSWNVQNIKLGGTPWIKRYRFMDYQKIWFMENVNPQYKSSHKELELHFSVEKMWPASY
jgi:hypothetical protein